MLVWLSQLVCLQRGADLHTSQLMPMPLTVSCKIQIGFTFLVPAQLGSHGKRVVKRVCVCVCVCFAPYWPWCPYLDVYITSTVYTASYAIHANIEIDQTMPYRFTVLCKINLTTFDFKIFLQISTSMHKCCGNTSHRQHLQRLVINKNETKYFTHSSTHNTGRVYFGTLGGLQRHI